MTALLRIIAIAFSAGVGFYLGMLWLSWRISIGAIEVKKVERDKPQMWV